MSPLLVQLPERPVRTLPAAAVPSTLGEACRTGPVPAVEAAAGTAATRTTRSVRAASALAARCSCRGGVTSEGYGARRSELYRLARLRDHQPGAGRLPVGERTAAREHLSLDPG